MNLKYRILHLADRAADAHLAAAALEKSLDFEQRVIASEAALLKMVNEFCPDVILCSHSCYTTEPGKIQNIIRRHGLSIPFILLSPGGTNMCVRRNVEDTITYISRNSLHQLPAVVLNELNKCKYGKIDDKTAMPVQAEEPSNNLLYRQLSEKLLLATRVAGIGIWEFDLARKRFAADEVLFSIYGISSSDFDGKYETWIAFVHPEDRGMVEKEFEAAVSVLSEINIEFRIIRRDGMLRYIQAKGYIEKNEAGYTPKYIGTNQDVTKRNEAELLRDVSEGKYRSFFENSRDGILITSSEGAIEGANPAACAIFQLSTDKLCQKNWNELLAADNISTGSPSGAEYESGNTAGKISFIRNDGARFIGDYTSSIFKDAQGLIKRAITIRDITAYNKVKMKLEVAFSELERAWSDVQKIMESSVDIICTIDEDGRFINVSSAAERIWGYRPNELSGRRYIELVVKEDIRKTRRTAADIMRGHPVTMFENRYRRKDGSIVPVLWSARWDEKDNVMYCVAKDATEKRSLEQAFQSERKRFYEILRRAPASLVVFKGAEHVFEIANNHFLKLMGRKNIIGKKAKDVFPELSDQGLFKLLDHVYTTGKPLVAHERLVKVDREGNGHLQHLYLDFVYQAYKNSENKIDGVFFFAVDVTEQVLSRQKIEQSEKLFRQIVETAQEGIWMLDQNNKTQLVNSAMCRMLGYSEHEILNKSPYYFLKDQKKHSQQHFFIAGGETTIDIYEDQFLTKSGKEVSLQLSTNPIYDESGIYKGALAMVTDVTEWKRLQEKITRQKVQQQKEITKATLQVQEKERNYLGSELHDNVSQILTAVKLNLSHYLDHPGGSVEIIESCHKYLSHAIDEIRKLSQRLVTHRFDEDSLIQEITNLFNGLPIADIIELDIKHLDEDLIQESVKLTLYRILQEHTNNIVKYAQAKKVFVKMHTDEKYVHLYVKDDGVGFNPKARRSGVGITSIYNRVESFNGTVGIESGEGRGCVLIARIPCQQPLSTMNM